MELCTLNNTNCKKVILACKLNKLDEYEKQLSPSLFSPTYHFRAFTPRYVNTLYDMNIKHVLSRRKYDALPPKLL